MMFGKLQHTEIFIFSWVFSIGTENKCYPSPLVSDRNVQSVEKHCVSVSSRTDNKKYPTSNSN